MKKIRCEREIVRENFEQKKESENKILGEIVGEKKTWEENLGK